jgi:hypothetical protein
MEKLYEVTFFTKENKPVKMRLYLSKEIVKLKRHPTREIAQKNSSREKKKT